MDHRLHVKQTRHSDTSFNSLIPELFPKTKDKRYSTSAEYVAFAKDVNGHSTHIEVPLDDILADLVELARGSLDLASLIKAGPVDFGIHLHALFSNDRQTFEYFIRQRLVHRWLRATWGGNSSFDHLYTKTFGMTMTRTSMVHLFGEMQWLTDLRVIDAWRLRHPQERSYSGPGRINRLDYIFVDHDLATKLSSVASYNANVHGGDHLSHTLMLSNNMPPPSKGYWRLPREFLDDFNVVKAIQEEASTFLDEMNSNPDRNHGAMWYGWLKRIKSQLVKCHRQHLQAGKANLEYLLARGGGQASL
ncbi:hypothetical protein H310_02808 [Aphanomyces invadans]|uniref:Uncharacterized protein n=1 Tax=Aphanomyces invadans TaxID=157072 RepID=A0A024UK83_9STRA|nr:hypothetical protein H310_02808 [Aphanomyces invadans]ETW06590.1 hypothetical protein H310_02808 [Aphanomyces invadans]|eukprot:XP_008864665.1 hypothetical protein H310_02808 [Aphanomyces invadans]